MAFNKLHKIIKNFGSEKIGRLSGNVVYFDDIAPNDHIDFKKTLLDHIYRVAAVIASKKGMEVFQLNFDARCNGEDLKSTKELYLERLQKYNLKLPTGRGVAWYMGKYLDNPEKKFEVDPMFWFDPADF